MELEQIEGTVEDIIYENPDNGYTVFEISGGGTVTVVCGIVGELHAGESVVCRGKYENHATYGRQFHAQECETDMPKDLEAVYAFLASGSLPYIGARTANKIIDKFGAAALEVIANDPAQLTLIPGISADKADRIQQEFKRMFGMRELIAYLAQFEISPRRAMEVFRVFGPSAMQAISQNPYLLCGEPLQLDFRHADSIAQYYHMEGDCTQRLEAALLRTLRHNAGNGHTCLPRAQLLDTASHFIQQPPEKLARALDHCIETGQLGVKMLEAVPYIYLPDLLEAEQAIADRLALLAKREKQTVRDFDKNIQVLELTQGFAYAPLQREAIRKAMTENCLVLTGGPGTGKTTILNAIIQVFAENKAKILLAAPTGRAAKRMSEAIGREARTIHRLLEYTPKDDGFARNEDNPLACGLLVVDEASMMDTMLAYHLLKAAPLGATIVFVGDVHQLPSVGPGNVLRDLIDSDVIPVIHLTEVFRQAAESLIVTSAHAIVAGEMPDLTVRDNDFFFLQKSSSEAVLQTVVDLCARRLPASYGYSPVRDIQVISPTRLGACGTAELCRKLQEVLNPQDGRKTEQKFGPGVFREGDKVMQIKNNYQLEWEVVSRYGIPIDKGVGIFNGDMGIIREIDEYAQTVLVEYDEQRRVTYTYPQMEEVELAYAITIHKSQGSEYPAVIMPLLGGPRLLFNRNLLYTGVTRARGCVTILGSRKVVQEMIANESENRRYTSLDVRIRELKGEA